MKTTTKFLIAAFGTGAALGTAFGAAAYVLGRSANKPLSRRLRAVTRDLMDLAGPLMAEVIEAQKQVQHKASHLGEQTQQQVQIGLDLIQDTAEDMRDALEHTVKTVQDSALSAKDTVLAARDHAKVRVVSILDTIGESGAALTEERLGQESK